MQAGGAAQGVSRRLTVLVAIAVITAMVTLLVLTGIFMTSTGEVETVVRNAGSAIIHDGAGKFREFPTSTSFGE